MASSAVAVANRTLTKLGSTRLITSFKDEAREARLVALVYDDMRDSLLREHTWRFAKRRVQLAASTTSPVFANGKKYFPLPSDFVRAVQSSDLYIEWEIEGNNILHSGDSFDLVYVARIEDTTKWDAFFTEALICRMAQEISIPLLGSESAGIHDRMEKLYQENLSKARHYGAVETDSLIAPSEAILSARIGGYGYPVPYITGQL